jgi:glycosyltransferase involved in cell wall biosynthesis
MSDQSKLNIDESRGLQEPVISVLMSVHNDEEYLEQAIKSILAQTYGDFEFLITDDSSTDESRSIIQQYAEHDDRIREFVNAENRGLTKTLNDMLRRVNGQLVARMDADDIARRCRFEKQVRVFESEPSVDVVFGDTCFIDNQGDPVCISWRPDESEIIKLLGTRCYIPHPTVMVRASAIQAVGGYDESYWTGQDHDLWRRMRDHGATFHYLSEVLLDYRLNPNSVHAKTSDDYWFRVCNVCIWNRNRRQSLAYLDRLTMTQQAEILLKMMVPHCVLRYRGQAK